MPQAGPCASDGAPERGDAGHRPGAANRTPGHILLVKGASAQYNTTFRSDEQSIYALFFNQIRKGSR
jgi:hypothetical protein